MKVLIDSSEPLADVLRVIGTMYDVVLSTADGEPPGTGSPRGARRSASASAKPTTVSSRRKRAATVVGGTADPKLVRQWARENGHEVSSRGSLPAAVRDAYQAANPS